MTLGRQRMFRGLSLKIKLIMIRKVGGSQISIKERERKEEGDEQLA